MMSKPKLKKKTQAKKKVASQKKKSSKKSILRNSSSSENPEKRTSKPSRLVPGRKTIDSRPKENTRALNPEILIDRARPKSQDAEAYLENEEEENLHISFEEFGSLGSDRTALAEEYDLDLPELNINQNALVSSAGLSSLAADPVTRYMAEISRYPVLTRSQEEEVAKKYYETRDPRLAEILVTANLRFVVKVAAEYSRFGAKLIDLIQEGNVGLMHAVKEFNPLKGVKLITYAVWWIRGYIQEYLMRQYSMVRIGTTQNQRKLFYQLQREKQELDRLGEDQGIRLISGRLGIPEGEVAEMHKRLSGRDVSLSQPLGQSETTQLLDMQTGDQGSEMEAMIELKEHLGILNAAIEQLRPKLSKKETYILEQRLLEDTPMTLQEIGDEWGVTREAVRQMEARLLSKLKETLLTNGLDSGHSK